MGRTDFSDQFQVIIRHKHIGYNLNVMQQSACLVINPITVGNFAALFTCMLVVRVSDSKAMHFSWDWSSFVCCLVHRGSTDDLLLLQISSGVVWQSSDLQLSCNMLYLLSPRLYFFVVLNGDLFVYRGDLLTS